MIIVKVWHAKANDTKMITVPKDCDIKAGDYVRVSKVEEEQE